MAIYERGKISDLILVSTNSIDMQSIPRTLHAPHLILKASKHIQGIEFKKTAQCINKMKISDGKGREV